MECRSHSKIKEQVSLFGMGCMRLPLEQQPGKKPEYGNINKSEAIKMIRHALDNGVNYLDTAYGYHEGNGELLLGDALKDGYREKAILATKLPVWRIKNYDQMEETLDEQLSKLQTDHLDIYLFHALNAGSWKKIKELGGLNFMQEMKKKGKIKYIGFSFHDKLEIFKDIIDSFDWDLCQIQFNILDEHEQAGLEGLKYAGQRNIPVVIMEPLKGGSLASGIPDEILEAWKTGDPEKSPVEWAFKWVGNFPEVLTILSGVSNMEQLEDNIRIFSVLKPGSMTEAEIETVKKVQALYKSRIQVPCTGCRYCMPCPYGVSIPEIFEHYNQACVFDKWNGHRGWYRKISSDNKDVSHCIECRQCEENCPQKIKIPEMLKEAHAALSQAQ